MVFQCYISRMSPWALRQYLKITLAYGFVHAVPYAWNCKTSLYSGHGRRELLVVDKASVIFANTVTAPILWPFLLRDDLIRVECFVRGKPVKDYLPTNDDEA